MPKLVALIVLLASCKSYSLDERSCPFNVHPSQVKGSTYRCGFVDMGNSDRTHVRVPVLVLLSGGAKAAPFVFLAGGPSQSWTNLGLEGLSASAIAAGARDYVFIEQRGTGASEPNLACLQGDGNPLSCGQRLDQIGDHPADFTTLSLADDIERIRLALGYDKLVLNGTSYGTTWARAALARGGEHIERAVLNSVVSATFPLLAHFASATDEAFGALFFACENDTDCSTRFPDLEKRFSDAILALKSSPLKDAQGKPAFDHDDFVFVTRGLLSSSPPDVPDFIDVIATAALGDGLLPTSSESDIEQGTDPNPSNEALGQYLAVFCADNAGVTSADIGADLSRVRASLRDSLSATSLSLRELCEGFPHGTALFDSSVYTGPVLLLAGQFDPRTPPSWARDALKTLQRGTLIVVPGEGHDVATSNKCLRGIVGDFMFGNDSPDQTCVPQLRASFTIPARGERTLPRLRHRVPAIEWVR